MTRPEASLAPSTDHGVPGTSWNVSCAGISRRSMGNSGGEKERLIRSRRRLRRRARAPDVDRHVRRRRVARRSEALRGGRGGGASAGGGCAGRLAPGGRCPDRGSRCRRRARRRRRCRARPRCTRCCRRTAPSPAPVSGSPPLQPQIVTRIGSLPPEDRDHADELVCVREEREGRDRDISLDSVPARDHERSWAARFSSSAIRVGHAPPTRTASRDPRGEARREIATSASPRCRRTGLRRSPRPPR